MKIPLRTYINYENDIRKEGSIKYKYILDNLSKYGYVDEHNGILTIDTIRGLCLSIFNKYDVEYCYLFGSYAKGSANEDSDVDLLISTKVTGLEFFELVEDLRSNLKKEVDLIDTKQLKDNLKLTNEILSDGIKIYG